MDLARIEGSPGPEVVSGHDLRGWAPERVEQTDFTCCGCPAPVIPRSYRLTNKKIGHFATKPAGPGCSGKHMDCDLFPDTSDANNGAEPAATTKRRRVSWPNRLVIPAERKVNDKGGELPPTRDRRVHTESRSNQHSVGDSASGTTTASSVRSFALAHRDMNANEREATPIALPDVNASRYKFAFRRLPAAIERLAYNRIFYGPLRWSSQVADDGERYWIELSRGGDWEPSDKKFRDPWIVAVDYRRWTGRRQEAFLDEFTTAASEARGTKKTPYVYVLGHQNQNRLSEISVTNWRLITVILES